MAHHHIATSASLGENVRIGVGCVIEEDVEIGAHTRLGHHVVIHAGSRVGSNVRIDDHAVVGKLPMRSPRSAMTSDRDLPAAIIGDGAQIGTGAVVYAGATLSDRVLVADYATIREDVHVGSLTIVGRGVAVENHCTIGERCKIETNAYITAHTTIEDDVFVAPGVLTSNDNYLGRTEERLKHFGGPHLERGCRIGVGAVLLPNRSVAEETVLAAGSVLTRDTERATVYAGIPARKLRAVPEEQLLERP